MLFIVERVYRFIGVVVVFFQAEDGIRYLGRSRGLGDVYKRQVYIIAYDIQRFTKRKCYLGAFGQQSVQEDKYIFDTFKPVSYTHLTLPTSDLV